MQELHGNVCTKHLPLIIHPAQAHRIFGLTSWQTREDAESAFTDRGDGERWRTR